MLDALTSSSTIEQKSGDSLRSESPLITRPSNRQRPIVDRALFFMD
jgi:hypothetical protein